MFSLSRQGMTASFLVCCLLGIGWLQFLKMQELLTRKHIASTKTLQRQISQEKQQLSFFKKIPSFGYDNILANWIYLKFLQYFGDDEVRSQTGYSLSPEYFEIILELDPRFITAYLSLSISTSLYAGMPEHSIKITEKGLKSLSPWVPKNSYYVWRYKGTDELLFLEKSFMAQYSFEMAANWASQHSDEDSKKVVSFSQKTAEFLSKNYQSKIARIATWTTVLNHQVNEKTRQRAIHEIKTLGGKVIPHDNGNYKVKLSQED
ncbi:hypothetical protein [Brasilonema sp. UFV-L1]|uniref:hypothetical protein n=1 Tax=Brasilonema sp. UFV-L1 TaxID=2234130 RepID=UPI00145CCA17|nr:hypothetical protein [Brasilonema sp. UFV-L1]NMG09461.1 hypothetical protein [Brasilonema sp. UFV-L1]